MSDMFSIPRLSTGGTRCAVNGSPMKIGNAKSVAELGMSDFYKEISKVHSGANGPDPAHIAKDRAVQAHTVFRQGGQIVAVVWRDGQTTMSNGLAARMDPSAIDRRTGGMTDAQRRDYLAKEILNNLGNSVKVERYGEAGQAPTRGAVEDEQAKAHLRARGR